MAVTGYRRGREAKEKFELKERKLISEKSAESNQFAELRESEKSEAKPKDY
jgi:hypothetical protein